jgi:RNA polymerase sporulation-specific sigma factor
MNHSYSENGRGANQTRNTQLTNTVESHLELVRSQARYMLKCNKNRLGLTENELVSAGSMGLLRAILGYDSERNVSFNTYATKCIRTAMLAEINKWHHCHTIEEQEIVNGEPLIIKKNEELFVHIEDLGYYPTQSVNCDWEAEEVDLYETLHEALDILSEKERRIIRAKFGFDGEAMKLHEIANEYGVSIQAVHKCLNKALSKLRDFFGGNNSPYAMCA